MGSHKFATAEFGNAEVRTPIFSGENYKFWRIKMVTIFKSHGLWNQVEKGITTPDSKKKAKTDEDTDADGDDDEKMAAIFMKDAKALDITQSAVSDQIFPRIVNADSTKVAWDLLYGEYHGGDQTFGETLPNERLVQKVLNSLTKMYDPICLVIKNTKCLESVELHKGKSKCYNYDGFGHWAKECTVGKAVQKANYANQREVAGNLFYANCVIAESKVNGEWYIDSGCSNHMTGNVDLLVDVKTNVAGKVQMPTEVLVNVAGMRSLAIETNRGRKYIREVMYLPGLNENLLSVGQMDEHGYYLVFGGSM
ncbi:uncharacterized protein [Pyrus communis]|uniref:uncharacterized protein n=1 Tax=Pyrus communis TaxID=23211 RepID=UPI0035C0A8FD